ncbi:MAG TPA: MFS transporter [Candidatus Obscuribacterales bacterium]
MTAETAPQKTVADGSKTLAKIALRLLPFMFVLYILSYLDRINVSFAGLQMNADLGFDESTFGLGAGIFFIGYFIFGVPSNLVLEKVGARRWIAVIMVIWGFITVALATVTDAAGFYTLRFLLGAAEAGFFPGMILYLTYWFPPKQRGLAVARFMAAIPTAGVLGGLIASQILELHGLFGLAGWKWLFIITGLPSVIMGWMTVFCLPDRPDKAKWLSAEEKDWLKERLTTTSTAPSEARSDHRRLTKDTIGAVALLSILYFSLTLGMYGFQLWLPQILKGFGGISDSTTALLSAVPAVFQAVGMIVIAGHSDKTGERRKHLAFAAALAAGGLIATSFIDNPYVALATLSLTAIGIWGTVGPFWSLSTALLSPSVAAAAIAFINSTGNLGGFAGPYLVGAVKTSTGHFAAGLYAMAFSLLSGALIALSTSRLKLKGGQS